MVVKKVVRCSPKHSPTYWGLGLGEQIIEYIITIFCCIDIQTIFYYINCKSECEV